MIARKLRRIAHDTDDARQVEALILAARDFQSDPETWIAAMQEARPDMAKDDLRMLADAFRGAWTVDGGLSAAELTEAQAWLHEGEDFAGLTPAPLDAFADLAPLKAVLDRLGPATTGK